MTVNPLAPTVTPVAATGVEGSAIALDLGVTVNSLSGDSSSLATLMLSAIPVGAVLSDGTNSFTASAGATSVDVHAWTLSSLTVTPPDATNFTLTVAATEKDVAGNLSATTTNTETVTVSAPNFGTLTIDSGATTEISSASAQNVSFTNNTGTTGELVLDDSKDFSGQILGFAGNGTAANSDLIDVKDVNFANVAMDKTTYVDNGNGTGTLTLYDAQGHLLASITFVGSYQLANFIVESDGNNGTLIIDPPVQSTEHNALFSGSPDSGLLSIESGSTTEIGGASPQNISFTNNSGTTGALLLDDSKDFTGHIVGFAGDGTIAKSDVIDLKDINFSHLTQESYTENSAGNGGTLSLSDGVHTANINFVGNYVLENFKLSNDGSNGTLIIDPPVTSTVNDSSSLQGQDQKGLFGGSSSDQGFSFNFDALHNPTSTLPNIPGNLDPLELKNSLSSEVDQLQLLLHTATDGAPHDIIGHTEGIYTGVIQLTHLHIHQDGISHP